MLCLEDVQTVQEAKTFYREVIRNCDIGLVRQIEAEPQELPSDSCKVRAAKAAYRKLRSFGRAADPGRSSAPVH